jgi:hypothetical protein
MQRLSVVLHGTLDSYRSDAMHEGGAAAVASLFRVLGLLCLPFFPPLLRVDSTAFFVI